MLPPVPVTKAAAFRFLNQATFGATESEAIRVMALGDSSQAYNRWIDEQLKAPVSLHLPAVQAAFDADSSQTGRIHRDRVSVWFRHAIDGPDQLRQRVAFALSEIFVVSQRSSLDGRPLAVAHYYDTLVQAAFGDVRELLEAVTLHPAMGVYLSMLGNRKPDQVRNIRPDENYARELMQLFSIGLVELNPDGTPKRDAQGQPIPTYDQDVIEGFAHVFTGWNWAWTTSETPTFSKARSSPQSQVMPMRSYPEQHATGPKRILGGVMLPAGQTPEKDLDDALDNIFAHKNMGPFLCKQLIQRLVTSNPSPAYVARVVAAFENDGSGRRGNLAAVIKAILLDVEARQEPTTSQEGKLKEPLLRITQLWRAYKAKSSSGKLDVNATNITGQGPLQAGSVFNFFSPFYAPPGEIADQNLVAPEAQIATEYQNTVLTNFFYTQVFNNVASRSPGPDAVAVDLAAEEGLIANSEALVKSIADKLFGEELSPLLAAEAKTLLEQRPESDKRRVSEALYLIVTSPEFALQR